MGKIRGFLVFLTYLFFMLIGANSFAADVTCPAGTYLPANATECVECESGSYCDGTSTCYANADTDCGITPCPTKYPLSIPGTSTIDKCYKDNGTCQCDAFSETWKQDYCATKYDTTIYYGFAPCVADASKQYKCVIYHGDADSGETSIHPNADLSDMYCDVTKVSCTISGTYFSGDLNSGKCVQCKTDFSGYTKSIASPSNTIDENHAATSDNGGRACYKTTRLYCTRPVCEEYLNDDTHHINSCESTETDYKANAALEFTDGTIVPRNDINYYNYICPNLQWTCDTHYTQNYQLTVISSRTEDKDPTDNTEGYDLLTSPDTQWCFPNAYAITLDANVDDNYNVLDSNNETVYEVYDEAWYMATTTDEYENVIGDSETESFPVPAARDGYTFVGYYTGPAVASGVQITDQDGIIKVSPDTFESDSALYAWWNPNVYTITLDDAAGDNGYGTLYLQYNSGWYTTYSDGKLSGNITQLAKIPTRDGYTFTGYYDANGAQIFDADGMPVDGAMTFTTSNATLTARWTENIYDVVLNGYIPGDKNSAKTVYFGIDTGLCADINCATKITQFADLGIADNSDEYTFDGFFFGGGNTLAFNRDTILMGDDFYQNLYKNGNISANTINLNAKWTHNIIYCVGGYYYPGTGDNLAPCDTDYYCPVTSGYAVKNSSTENPCVQTACATLAIGEYADLVFYGFGGGNAIGPESCYVTIPAGNFLKYDDVANKYIISQCPHGYINTASSRKYYGDSDFATAYDVACSACDAGLRANDDHTACVACPIPPFANSVWSNNGKSCSVEYSATTTEHGTIDNVSCTLLADNQTYVCSVNGDPADNVKCDAGYTLNGELSDFFTDMGDGTYQINADVINGSVLLCRPTDQGHYSDGTGYEQEICPPGQYQEQTGQTGCDTCESPAVPGAAEWQQTDGIKCSFVYRSAADMSDQINNLANIDMTCTWQDGAYQCVGDISAQVCDAQYEFIPGADTDIQGETYFVSKDEYILNWVCKTLNFEIMYDEDGDGSVDNTITCNKNNGTVTFYAPSKYGYGFAGWYEVKDGVLQSNALTQYDCSRDILLQATWTVNKYKCEPGEYLPAGATECADCTDGNYCEGGTYAYNATYAQGTNACVDASGYAAYDKFGTSGAQVSVDASVVSSRLAESAGECYVIVPDGHAAHVVQKGNSWNIAILPCGIGTAQRGDKVQMHELQTATPGAENTFTCTACTGAQYADKIGMSTCVACPSAPAEYGKYAQNLTISGGASCLYQYAKLPFLDESGTLSNIRCYWDDGIFSCVAALDGITPNNLTCAAGRYYNMYNHPNCSADFDECNSYYTEWDDNLDVVLSGHDINGVQICEQVGQGYYSAENELTRHTCPDNYTVGAVMATRPEDCAIYVPAGQYLDGNGDTTLAQCESGYYCPGDYTLFWGNYAWVSQPKRAFDLDNGFTGTIASDGKSGRFACRDDLEMTYFEEFQWVNGRDFWSESGASVLTDCRVNIAAGEYVWFDEEAGYVVDSCPSNAYKPDSQTFSVQSIGQNIYALSTSECTSCPVGYTDGTTLGNTSVDQCVATCPRISLDAGGTAIPNTSTVAYPATCQYEFGESVTGNPCDLSCSADDIAHDCYCIEKSCNPDYELINGRCFECNRDYALGYADSGNCIVTACVTGYHPDGQQCSPDIVECSAPNAVYAERRWDTDLGAFSECVIMECESGYHVEANACQPDLGTCELPHGIGEREWDADLSVWGPCIPTECDPGYTTDSSQSNALTSANQCGECKNAYGPYGERVVSSYVRECEIATCMYQGEIFALMGDRCELICQGEDETGRRVWNKTTNKCDHYCEDGYTRW